MERPEKLVAENKQKGFVLIMMMLLLSILSLSAFIAVEQSQLSYMTNHSRLAQIKARHIAEEARLTSIRKLETLLMNNALPLTVGATSRFEKDGLIHFERIHYQQADADVYIHPLPTHVTGNGISLAQNMAYSGVGMGLGAQGSFSARYEIRSKGVYKYKGSEVVFWTASDYQFVP